MHDTLLCVLFEVNNLVLQNKPYNLKVYLELIIQ